MRILYHHRIASKDGQYVHVEELTRALEQLGHELVMVGPGSMRRAVFGGSSGLVARMKRAIPGAAYELLEFGYSLVAFVKLVAGVIRYRPDVIYERYNLYLPAGVWASRLLGVPLLLEVNAPLLEERSKFGGIALPRLARWTENTAWRGADALLPVTMVLADRLRDRGVDQERITVIPNGVNQDRFSGASDSEYAKSRLGLSGKLVLGFTGFVRDWHGLDRVVELLAQGDEERHLLVVGDGPACEGLRHQAAALGVGERVTITGVVERDQIGDYVAAFDIALQPDVVDYASPLKLFEYLALGRPVVAPDKPNIREVLSDGQNAALFDPEAPGAFQTAIERLCRDPAMRRQIGERAIRTIGDGGFTWIENARQVERIALSLVEGRRQPVR